MQFDTFLQISVVVDMLFFFNIHVYFCEARNFATDAMFTHGKSFQHISLPVHTVV